VNKVEDLSVQENEQNEDWSLRKLAQLQPKELHLETFKNRFTVPIENDDIAYRGSFEYVQIMHQQVFCEGQKRFVLQINDRAAAVHMREEKEEKILMATVNATASHDTRNPLNAIHAQNLVMKMQVGQISDLLEILGTENFRLSSFKKRLKDISRKLTDSLHINDTCERFLSLMIEDFLDL
jgi:signal transduction histidine kinase